MRSDSNQGALALFNDFEQSTAQQLAYERNRDTPTEQDMADAVVMCAMWNLQRIKLELKAWQ
jgi:hypothetical protein